MTHYYVDSSVLVKRHIREMGSNWVNTLFDLSANNSIITAQISMVEVYSALNRRVRENILSQVHYITLRDDFDALCSAEYSLIALTTIITDISRSLLERYPLRAYDSIQLATALTANMTLTTSGLEQLIFLSADERLLTTAQAERLSTDNPNTYV